MTPQKTSPEGDDPVRQVNNILQSLRGEHFRHSRNVQGNPVSSDFIASHARNQPTLPINLIYPSQQPSVSSSRIAGPRPPRSWRTTVTSTSSSQNSSRLPKENSDSRNTNHIDPNGPAWRKDALSLVFSSDLTSSPSSTDSARFRGCTYPNSNTVPHLTLLCLQLILAACPGADLTEVAPYIPPHLRRALLRYTAIHSPLSKTELDALCDGASHVDGELIITGPHTSLRGNTFKKNDRARNTQDTDALERSDCVSSVTDSWDAMQIHDNEPTALFSLAVLSSPVSATAFQASPPTITHLALINIPHRFPLQRLPTICPLLVLLDLSYNAWLSPAVTPERGGILEEVGWGKLRRLEVLGLRGCLLTAKVLIELNRGRWEDVVVIR